MATDGGQIRTAKKILAEQNHSHTCTTLQTMTPNKSIIGGGARKLTPHTANNIGILITDINGNATFIPVPDGAAGQNKVLATDTYGNLNWITHEGGN